jgi:uncharacterized membrane protein YbaN (DUF454 family)
MQVQHLGKSGATIPASLRSSVTRGPFLVLGWLMVGLGIIGVFLPLLPTTVFMLIALWAFSRSSPRFRTWLYSHPRFGPPLRAWQQNGAISARVKLLAVLTMTASFTVIAVLAEGWILPAVVGAGLAAIAAFLITRPAP